MRLWLFPQNCIYAACFNNVGLGCHPYPLMPSYGYDEEVSQEIKRNQSWQSNVGNISVLWEWENLCIMPVSGSFPAHLSALPT